MNKVLFLVNGEVGIYNLRRELVQELLDDNYQVYISCPAGEKTEKLVQMGCHHIDLRLNRHGKNPIEDFKLLAYYLRIIKKVNPDSVLTYTTKPNIYGSLAAKILKIPFVTNITGLGTAVSNSGILQKLTIFLYKLSQRSSVITYFQNNSDLKFFQEKNVIGTKYHVLPGSGVNIQQFNLLPYPGNEQPTEFIFIARIMKEKGIDQYLSTAEYIVNKYPRTKFHICGFLEDNYKEILQKYEKKGIIEYHGMVKDIHAILEQMSCTIHPTYYPEGMSNVILESAASGRPVITTNRPGTKEAIINGKTGYIFEAKDTEGLIARVEQFLSLSHEQRVKMGTDGRKYITENFNRQIIVDEYMKTIRGICGND